MAPVRRSLATSPAPPKMATNIVKAACQDRSSPKSRPSTGRMRLASGKRVTM